MKKEAELFLWGMVTAVFRPISKRVKITREKWERAFDDGYTAELEAICFIFAVLACIILAAVIVIIFAENHWFLAVALSAIGANVCFSVIASLRLAFIKIQDSYESYKEDRDSDNQ